jgi:hypothetical protein
MIYAAPSTTFEAATEPVTTGLVSTIGVRIVDGQGATTTARTTAGIVETPAGSGIYVATLTAPATAGQYVVVWDTGSGQYANEDLVVTTATTVSVISGSFTYDPTTDLGQVRLEIGDTDSDSALFTDQEIGVKLAETSNVLLASAALLDLLATRFAREFDFSEDGQSFKKGSRSAAYAARAQALRNRANGVQTVVTQRADGYSDDLDTREATGLTGSSGRTRFDYGDHDLPD